MFSSQLENHQFQMLDAISALGHCCAKRAAIHLLQIAVAAAARNHYAQYATMHYLWSIKE